MLVFVIFVSICRTLGDSKVLPRLPRNSSDQLGSTESVSAGSDHDDIVTEPAAGEGYTTPPVTRKRKRLSMSPEINEAPTGRSRLSK